MNKITHKYSSKQRKECPFITWSPNCPFVPAQPPHLRSPSAPHHASPVRLCHSSLLLLQAASQHMTTGPWGRGGRATTTTTSLALLLLLLACVAGCSISSVRAQATVFTGTVAGREITNFSFPKFDQNRVQLATNLTFTGNASVSQGALQVTPDSANNFERYLVNQTGRIFYSTPFLLWASNASNATADGRHVASFSTVFQINLYRANKTVKGEGLAFVVASGVDDPPPGSDGGYLGLTNASTDGLGANGFAAVELDTVKQSYDPDDNHVGLDVNGVHSTAAIPLAPYGVQLAPSDNSSSGDYMVWIDYNGTTRHVWVYISPNDTKPATAVLNASLDLSTILLDKTGYFGFSASTGVDYQLNCVKLWNMTVEVLHDDSLPKTKTKLSGWKLGLVVGVPCAAALALGLLAGLYLMMKKRKKQVGDDPSSVVFHNAIDLRSIPGVPKEFDYKELRKGTNSFDDKMKLGQGGYGVVYRATVPGDNGQSMEVAVKQFSGANTKGQEDFLAELSIINRLRHRNLVKLVGKKLLLITLLHPIKFCLLVSTSSCLPWSFLSIVMSKLVSLV